MAQETCSSSVRPGSVAFTLVWIAIPTFDPYLEVTDVETTLEPGGVTTLYRPPFRVPASGTVLCRALFHYAILPPRDFERVSMTYAILLQRSSRSLFCMDMDTIQRCSAVSTVIDIDILPFHRKLAGNIGTPASDGLTKTVPYAIIAHVEQFCALRKHRKVLRYVFHLHLVISHITTQVDKNF